MNVRAQYLVVAAGSGTEAIILQERRGKTELRLGCLNRACDQKSAPNRDAAEMNKASNRNWRLNVPCEPDASIPLQQYRHLVTIHFVDSRS